MAYLLTLPGFIFGLYLAWTDLRRRRVPRRAVILGLLAQGLAVTVLCLARHDMSTLIGSVMICLACTGVQCLLALVRPGALGLGDVTATALLALSLGPLGWTTTLVWWLLMGVLGLGAMAIRRIGKDQSSQSETLAYVPVILLAAVAAAALSGLAGW